jgi:hypothetical protein
MHLHAGELTTAASLVREFTAVKKATSAGVPDFGAMLLAAWQGRSRDALWLIEEIVSDMDTRGRGFGVSIAHYAASVLRNGLGQYEDALASAELAVSHPEDLGFANLALAELIEAAVRSGRPERAAIARQRLTALTQPSGTAWGLGVAARSRALLSEGDIAERLYHEAIACLGSAPAGAELARAHLLYGEWLHSEDRRGEAREHLQAAHGMLQEMEIGAFGDRAGRMLAAASGARRARPLRLLSPGDALTEQEAQIARLARAACPTLRSVPGCSSARARSSTTWARCSRSWVSPRAASCSGHCRPAGSRFRSRQSPLHSSRDSARACCGGSGPARCGGLRPGHPSSGLRRK